VREPIEEGERDRSDLRAGVHCKSCFEIRSTVPHRDQHVRSISETLYVLDFTGAIAAKVVQ
jgi:hypothetical protein